MLSVTVGKGRKKKTLEFPQLNHFQLFNMTELTQKMMFGEVVNKRSADRSIHPFGRHRLSGKDWAVKKALSIELGAA